MSEDRFPFGANWRRFLGVLDDERIAEAERSLTAWLGADGLRGRTFLDAGCGSGLFSLAALRLGAARVHSFDFDPQSVACAAELRRRYAGPGDDWTVEQGDVLDEAYIAGLGQFDVVYSWGVLHHTGAMWRALRAVEPAVGEAGRLWVAIYNDEGGPSRRWAVVKRIYNRLPRPLQTPYALLVMGPRELAFAAMALVRGRPGDYVRMWTQYKSTRGMSRWHDILDWVGGYPFEVAKSEQIFELYRAHGFALEELRTCSDLGCNELLLRRPPAGGG